MRLQMAKLGRAMTTAQTGQAPEPSAAEPAGAGEPQDLLMEEVHENGKLQPAAAQQADGGAGTQGTWVQPQRFKSLVGRGHSEFSTGRQQVRPPWPLWHRSASARVGMQARSEWNAGPQGFRHG